ncbi:MAG: oxidoreductase [Coxiella sp. RIFCSPHIGHO2_12_FULL_42_15]|nr:MAG: oxidoreductase [Coxiella sp. RIFCSPHIGHO2_12_FULL_42_15]
MKVIVVGLGVQGHKRRAIAGSDYVACVDPINVQADYKHVSEVPLNNYDAALVCTPDQTKIEILTYLIQHKKHILVEKPLYASDPILVELQTLAQQQKVVCYTAYNHRFEPHLMRMRDVIQSGGLGACYHARFFYGNGTARLVRDSAWRDQGAGVLPDLGSHLLDLSDFIFGVRGSQFQVIFSNCFENNAPDHVTFVNRTTQPQLEFEMTLLSWRNHFSCDVLGEKGSVHVESLCKWGPSTFTLRKRILPSGRPPEQAITLVQEDPTWALEYAHFKKLIIESVATDLSRDRWMSQQLQLLNQTAIRMASTCQTV